MFRASDRYRDLASMTTRCATLTYAGDFCLDVVPCVVDRRSPGTLEVCNRNDGVFEPTNPLRDTAWLAERNMWVGSNHLQHAMRLIKYLRDIIGHIQRDLDLNNDAVGSHFHPLDGRQQNRGLAFGSAHSRRFLVWRLVNLFLSISIILSSFRNPVLPSVLSQPTLGPGCQTARKRDPLWAPNRDPFLSRSSSGEARSPQQAKSVAAG